MNTLAQPQPLENRYSGTTGPGADLIYRWLRARHRLGVGGALLGIAAGVVLMVGSAWLISVAVAWLAERLVSLQVAAMAGWPVFWVYLLAVPPLLVWQTLHTGRESSESDGTDADLFPTQPLIHGPGAERSRPASPMDADRLFYWAPRLFVDGVRRLLGRDVVRCSATIRRGTFILAHLLRASEAVRTKALRIPDEPIDQFQAVLRWLDRHGYIGISSDGQRVWIRTEVREALSGRMRTAPVRSPRKEPVVPQLQRFMDKRELVDIIFKR
jgi:hypothetical protein